MSDFVEKFMEILAEDEGTRGRKQALEGGGGTRGYGITSLSNSFESWLSTKGANADDLSDKDLAQFLVEWNIEELQSELGNDKWESLPESMKIIAVDMRYNAGKLFPGFKRDLLAGDYQSALNNTLDIISASDPESGGKGILGGLVSRRARNYNRAASELGFPQISSYNVGPSSTKNTAVTYLLADGSDFVVNTGSGIHSAFTSGFGDYDVEQLDQKKTFEPVYDDEIMRRQRAGEVEIVSPEPAPVVEEEPVEEAPSIVPMEMANVSDDKFFIKRMQRANEAPILNIDLAKLPEKPDETIKRVMQQDYDYTGPVSETIRREQFGVAGPVLFSNSSSEIWKAAFSSGNPMVGLSRVISDTINSYGIDDDPDYDVFSDPQVSEFKDSMWRLYDSKSSEETAIRLKRLKQEVQDQQILSESFSTGQYLGAALATPSTAMPVAPLRAMRAASIGKRFATGAAFTGGVVASEQAILQSSKQMNDPEAFFRAVALSSLVGGSVNAAFGKSIAKGYDARFARREANAEAKFGGDGFYESVGAAVSPEKARQTAYALIERDAAAETGVGVEKLGWNPVLRMLKSNNPIVRGLTAQMVDMGGVMQKKVGEEIAMSQSVEKAFSVNYIGRLVEALRASDEAYLAYRGVKAKDGDVARSFQIMGQQVKDKFNRQMDVLSEVNFRIRVGKAMRRGEKDSVTDAATPFVEQAARASREHLNFIKKNAEDVRLFEVQIRKALKAAKESGDQSRIAVLQERLNRVVSEGVFLNNAISYLPRVYRIDKIMANVDKFKAILRNYANAELGLRGSAADDFVDNAFDSITKSKPYMAIDEGVDNFEDVVVAGSARSRELDIADTAIEEFLESDIEVLLRHHTKTMGMDIELTRAFGSVDMKGILKQAQDEWELLISNTKDAVKKAEYEKQMIQDLTDIRGLRDRLRGTYGASKDPHAMSSRFVRTMKSINVLVGMGGATISSIPDIARPVMVEGFKTVYDKGLRSAFRQHAKTLNSLSKKELRAAGVAADAVLGLRAHAFADMGDVFGNRFAVERFLGQSTGVMFLLNGLNVWNQALKEFAGNVTMLRMTDSIMKPWNKLSKADKEKLLKNGIDQQMAFRMQASIKKHGQKVDGEWMPNTEAWTDGPARQAFRIALNQNVDRIIITPGAGDRALWTSTEFGSLLTQFKSYGQAATMRLLTAGLQERDGAFWQGAFLIVGLAAIVNEIKRKQYGITRKESFDQKLINAVERSGMLGWFMDANNAVEKLSNYGLGSRPMLTDQRQYPVPFGAKVGAVFGPAASNAVNVANVATDVLGGNANQKTLDTLRFITPFSNLPYLDPAFDYLYGQ